MATVIQQRRGTKSQHDDGAGFTGAVGEITVDTTDDTLRVHDGSLKGGHVIAKLSDVEASDTLAEMSDVNLTSPADGSVLKYDNASSKWIDSSKLTETATGIDVTGNVKGDSLTIDNGSGDTNGYIASATGATRFTVKSTHDGEVTEEVAGIEVGAKSLSYLDLKTPDTDDYDLRIYHSEPANHSMINSLNEDLFLRSGGKVALQHAGGNTKLETTTTGIDVTGTVTTDLVKLNPTGGASEGGQIEFQRAVDNQTAWYVDAHGSGTDTSLRFVDNDDTSNPVNRVSMNNTGIDVTGTVDCDGLKMDDGEYAQFGTANDLQIFHSGTHSYIKDRGTGILSIQSDGDSITFHDSANTRDMAKFSVGGTASLNWAGGTGTGTKLATTETGIDVTGTVEADDIILSSPNGTRYRITVANDGTLTTTAV